VLGVKRQAASATDAVAQASKDDVAHADRQKKLAWTDVGAIRQTSVPSDVALEMLRPLFADQVHGSDVPPAEWEPPVCGWKEALRTAAAFQLEFASHIPMSVCAVCACFRGSADIQRVPFAALSH
jgi:thioesterase domain-containing protein